jgi:hypothetical protein
MTRFYMRGLNMTRQVIHLDVPKNVTPVGSR